MKATPWILILVVSLSCSAPEYKTCEFATQDLNLKLYHDILTELIERHFYKGYLEQVSTDLEKYPPILQFSDTAAFERDAILAQNKLFNDTAKFETICYRSKLVNGPWKYFYRDTTDFIIQARADTAEYIRNVKDFLRSFSADWEAVADTIAQSQGTYTHENFKLCTSNVVPYTGFKECDIGVMGFSKVFFNGDKTKGLLYYEFICGVKCGKGEIIQVQLIGRKWSIRNVLQLWIS